MLLYNLGSIPWEQTQLVYHALAYLGREALVLCAPQSPYVSLGFHQDHTQELDLEYCRERGLPIFRREVGGGAVYLDGEQIFWQLVLRPDNPLVPLRRDVFYKRFLGPVIAAYRAMGLPAEFRPVNDLAVDGRKVSGTGAGEIGDCLAFVGNVMRDFDTKAMARVIAAPDQDFRERFRELMEQNLSTLRHHLGRERALAWSTKAIREVLAVEFAKLLGPLQEAWPDAALVSKVNELSRVMLADPWTRFPRKPRPGRKIKIKADLFLHHRELAGDQGVWTARFLESEGLIRDLELFLNQRPAPTEISRAALGLQGAPLKKAAALAASGRGDLQALAGLF